MASGDPMLEINVAGLMTDGGRGFIYRLSLLLAALISYIEAMTGGIGISGFRRTSTLRSYCADVSC